MGTPARNIQLFTPASPKVVNSQNCRILELEKEIESLQQKHNKLVEKSWELSIKITSPNIILNKELIRINRNIHKLGAIDKISTLKNEIESIKGESMDCEEGLPNISVSII